MINSTAMGECVAHDGRRPDPWPADDLQEDSTGIADPRGRPCKGQEVRVAQLSDDARLHPERPWPDRLTPASWRDQSVRFALEAIESAVSYSSAVIRTTPTSKSALAPAD